MYKVKLDLDRPIWEPPELPSSPSLPAEHVKPKGWVERARELLTSASVTTGAALADVPDDLRRPFLAVHCRGRAPQGCADIRAQQIDRCRQCRQRCSDAPRVARPVPPLRGTAGVELSALQCERKFRWRHFYRLDMLRQLDVRGDDWAQRVLRLRRVQGKALLKGRRFLSMGIRGHASIAASRIGRTFRRAAPCRRPRGATADNRRRAAVAAAVDEVRARR